MIFCVILCFLYEPKAELQKQQQQFVAQKLIAAQRHVAVTHQPQPQKATIVYRSQQVPSNEQAIPKQSSGEGRQRGRSERHGGRYTSGKKCFACFFCCFSLCMKIVFFSTSFRSVSEKLTGDSDTNRVSFIITNKFHFIPSITFEQLF